MKNKNTVFTVLFVTLVLLTLGLWIFFFRPRTEQPHVEGIQRRRGGPCPGEIKTFVMEDSHMRGILEVGDKFKVIYNYYDCNPVERNDLVYYQFSTAFPPIVRIARAVGGDKFKLKHDKKHPAWNILVNGDMVNSEIGDHEPYFFGADTPPTLSLILESRKAGLFSDDVIALASYSPGENDSGVFGIVKIPDIVGKVEKLDGSKELEPNAESLKDGQKSEPTPTPGKTLTVKKNHKKI